MYREAMNVSFPEPPSGVLSTGTYQLNVPKLSPLTEALNELEGAIDIHAKRCEELETRLAPLRRIEPVDGCRAANAEAIQSPITDRVRELARRIRNITTSIDDIQRTLDV